MWAYVIADRSTTACRRYDGFQMKPQPPPYVPGNTEAERMDNAVRKMFSVSKDDVLKAEAEEKRAKTAKRKHKRNGHQNGSSS